MELTQQQISDYHENGFLVIKNVFSEKETQLLINEMNEIQKSYSFVSKNHITSYGQKILFGAHKTSKLFSQLSRSQRILAPCKSLLDNDDVYIHQSRIVSKKAMVGDGFFWHQDYAYYHFADDIPTPKLLTCCVFLSESTEFNGPFMVSPGSHKEAVMDTGNSEQFIKKRTFFNKIKSKINNERNTYDQAISNDKLTPLLKKYGIESIKEKPGSILFFNGNLLHASLRNISPDERNCFFITYNSIHNAPSKEFIPRSELMAESNDFKQINPLSDKELTLFLK